MVLAALSIPLFSQTSSLTVRALSPEGEPAEGYFILFGNVVPDDVMKVRLSDGVAYFPLNAVGLDEICHTGNISIYPNPVFDQSAAMILLNDNVDMEALRIYNAEGRLLFMGEDPLTQFKLDHAKGLLLLQFQSADGHVATRKLFSNHDFLTISVISSFSGIRKSAQTNAYSLVFQDLDPRDPEFEVYYQVLELDETEHKEMEIVLDYSRKNIVIEGSSTPGSQGYVKTDTTMLGGFYVDNQGNIPRQIYHYPFSKNKSLPIDIEISDDHANPLLLKRNAFHDQVINIDTFLTYRYRLYSSVSSPKGAKIQIFNDGELTGSDTIGEAGEYEIVWTGKSRFMTVDSIVVMKEGYPPRSYKNLTINSGEKKLDVILLKAYPYALAGSACSPTGALAEIYKEDSLLGWDIIDDEGHYSINWEYPSAEMVMDSIVFSADYFAKQVFEHYNISTGLHKQEVNLEPVTYRYSLRGTECSPAGSDVRVYKNGLLIVTDEVDSAGQYIIGWEGKNIETNLAIDSVVFYHEGYVSQTFTDLIISPGELDLNCNLEFIIDGEIVVTQTGLPVPMAVITDMNDNILATTGTDGGFEASIAGNGKPIRVKVSADGFITRTTGILDKTHTVTIDIIEDKPPFSSDYYGQLVYHTNTAFNLTERDDPQPSRQWIMNPKIYIKTTYSIYNNGVFMESGTEIVPQTALDKVSESLPVIFREVTGGRLEIDTVEYGTDRLHQGENGWITIDLFDRTNNPQPFSGSAANWLMTSIMSGMIILGTTAVTDTNTYCPIIGAGLIFHETGHCLGLGHTVNIDRPNMMAGGLGCVVSETHFSSMEQYHAQIMYSRPRGNTYPDNDPDDFAF